MPGDCGQLALFESSLDELSKDLRESEAVQSEVNALCAEFEKLQSLTFTNDAEGLMTWCKFETRAGNVEQRARLWRIYCEKKTTTLFRGLRRQLAATGRQGLP